MGMDIHMHIVKGNELIKEDIFDGRNSEWFRNLQGEGCKDEYNYLPIKHGIFEGCPDPMKSIYEGVKNKDEAYFGYFGFHYINVKDFCDWFEKYKPDTDAGWVTTYEKWAMENKGYVPEYVSHSLDKNDNVNDMCFIEVKDPWDCSRWLYDYIHENRIPYCADIVYCFDW